MSVVMSGGIGYSSRSRAAYTMSGTSVNQDGSLYSVPKERSQDNTLWAKWGHDNLLPNRMADDIEKCGVLSAGLDAKARIACGRGILPFFLVNVDKEGKEELQYCNDSEIHDWLELNDAFTLTYDRCYDKYGYGWSPLQLLLNRGRTKINRIKRTDVVETRLEKKNNWGIVNNLYLCANWCDFSAWNADYMRKVPILEEGNELLDLQDRSSGYEFAIIDRQLRNGRGYYPPPLWYATKAWVDIAKSIPAMKKAMFENQMTIKYVVTISADYWKRQYKSWDSFTIEKQEQLRQDKLDEIDEYLSGTENQYKSIFANNYIDPVTKVATSDIKIDVLDDKVKDGKLLPDSSAAVSEILFAIMVNPALMGAGQPGGAYANNAGGSNIRESYLTQIMLLEAERRMNARVFDIVKKYNGWSKRLETAGKRLVFRYPANVLTTLDTGKSTKGEIV